MDWNARRYHALSDPQALWAQRVLRRLAPAPGERILDLGCGTARTTTILSEMMGAGHVIGVDVSEAMLREASTTIAAAPVFAGLHDAAVVPVRLSLVRADAAALPFADVFDGVISTAALHWIPDHATVFASVYRTLAPGGRFVAQCGGAGNLEVLLGRAAALLHTAPFDRHARLFSPSWQFPDVPTTMLRLEHAGFTAIDVLIEEASTLIPGREAFAEFVEFICLRPHLDVLPADLRPEFVSAIVDLSAADPEPFLLDFRRLNLSARKPAAAEQAA
jgi:trans-aconitate 2-methyltransferase